MSIIQCGIDTAKNVFQFHGLDEEDNVTRKTLRRKQLLPYFAKLEPCLIGIEASGGSHYWARELTSIPNHPRNHSKHEMLS